LATARAMRPIIYILDDDKGVRASLSWLVESVGLVARAYGSAAEFFAAFEAEGWDVTDDKRRPLRVLGHFNQQLWLALRGVAGTLPFLPDDDRPDPWGASLAAEAKRFRKR